MNRLSFFAILLSALTAIFLSSCSSDEVRGSITLSQQAIYFSSPGESAYITYTCSNMETLEVDDVPDGWAINVNRSSKKILVVGPATLQEFNEYLGTTDLISFTVTSKDDLTGTDYLTVGLTKSTVDISDQQSNSFMVNEPNTIYSFSALSTGEDVGTISPSTVAILWQTTPEPLSYSRLVDDKVEFHVTFDEDDEDEDGEEDDIIEGNAVIAAYDSSGNILWSWHIWVSDYSVEADVVSINGIEIMGRNLGAAANNTSDAASVLASYGLYYQWGRKDPFIGPYYYDAAGSTDEGVVSETGSGAYITYSESTSSIGTTSYATKNPLTFILGVEESSYDWIYSSHNDDLWSDTKGVNDPCPKGWRVASPELYNGLMIPALSSTELSAMKDDYGWYLTDSRGDSALFMGLGRRGYITGKIQNVNLNASRPSPWSGYYWTTSSEASSTLSEAMYFAFDDVDISGNEITMANYYRSNGMQIRCQRE